MQNRCGQINLTDLSSDSSHPFTSAAAKRAFPALPYRTARPAALLPPRSPISQVVPWLQEDSTTGQIRGGCDGALLTETSAKDNLIHLLEHGFFDAHRQAEKASREAEPDLAKAKAAVRLVHRVALFDKGGRISGMVSQTDVIRGLAENARSFEDVSFRSLRDLGALLLGVSGLLAL